MQLYRKWFAFLETWLFSHLEGRQDNWLVWREKIMLYSLLMGCGLIIVAFIPSIVLLAHEQKFSLLIFSSVFLTAFMGLIVGKTLPYIIRAWSVSGLLFAMGNCIMFVRGPFTSGLLWLFLSVVAATVLIHRRAAVRMNLANLGCILSLGAMIWQGPPLQWNLLAGAPLLNWSITGLIFMSLSFIVIFSLDYVLKATHHAFEKEREVAMHLEREIEEHGATTRELRESEKKFRTLVEASPLAVSLLGGDGEYKYLNPRFTEMFGYAPADVPAGRDWFRLAFPEDEDRKTAESLWQADLKMAGTGLMPERVFTVRCKDNSLKQICIRPVAIDPENWLLTYEDVTERSALEARLRQTQKMEALGTLTSGIAHDFNNILGIIIGYAELSLLNASESDDTVSVREILNASNRAQDIVSHLLTFIRQRKPVFTIMDIRQAVKENTQMLRASFPSNIGFSIRIPETLPNMAGDAGQISQVIINLTTNAAHAMADNGGTIGISLESAYIAAPLDSRNTEDFPGEFIRLEVSDTGNGIDPEHMDRIFDPYFTTKEVGKGSGLGLSVVMGIVKSHRGHIRVSSKAGKGTRFDIFFPATSLEPDVKNEPVKPSLAQGTEAILFVDDEPGLIEVAGAFLKRLGYQVTVAHHPADALDLVRLDPDQFDLVITDMGMPVMSGDRLSRELMKIRPDLPIILCTGFSEILTPDEALDMGLKAYLEKPLNLGELAETVRAVLDGGSVE